MNKVLLKKYDPKSIITSLVPDLVDEGFHDFEQTIPDAAVYTNDR